MLTLLPAAELEAGWWRLALLTALPLGLVGIYLRRRVTESPVSVAATESRAAEPRPVWLLWPRHRRPSLTRFCVLAAGSLAFNTFVVFLRSHLIVTTEAAPSRVLLLAVVGLLGGAAAALWLGWLSDRVGRRPVVLASLGGLALGAAPILGLARHASVGGLLVANLLAGCGGGGCLVPLDDSPRCSPPTCGVSEWR
ncbi:MAG: MFS transporter [Nocardioides sp.]